ncbi:hypothetical protein D7V21_12865 [Acinetobacter guerrae]|uniref:Protein FilF n=1 Tax=Acinetobacter guerrae TaxID=1843371 RepID=A0A3A8EUB5_9GAMM|nr:hypothetical protein [Acinetobacter guerrae]RKG32023.1 hypothetical protein D7V21_12865 [Acinetobacter guerrae]
MKKQILIPFTLTALMAALSGCGGEGGNINVDSSGSSTGVTASTSCSTTSSDCLEFVFDYPVAGLNFDCSSDTTNHFITQNSSNAVAGACKLGDTVTFSIKGQGTDKQIKLGTVDLKTITSLKISDAPISLVDIATAMVGKAPASLDQNDETIKVAMALVKIFQAAGVVNEKNAIGDLQPITLDEDYKSNLKNISQSIDVTNFKDGSYAAILKPWVDVSGVSDQTAFDVVNKMLNMQNAGSFQSDFLPWPLPAESGVDQQYIEGFHGKSLLGNEIIANMYLLSDRTGHTFGYGLQWKGKPDDKTSAGTIISDSLKRMTLISKVAPQKMNAESQTNWISPITKKLGSTPYVFSMADQTSTPLTINQGRLINGYIITGTEAVYKQATGSKEGDPASYGKWTQDFSPEQFEGTIDISKTNPITYLDKKILTTQNNTNSGEYYVFPMYATLNFKFSDTTIKDVKLGVVIDENGDIRSDIKPNATANDMSGTCATVNPSTMIDSNGVQQFRIGTTGTANYAETDKSITIRMILTNAKFGLLEGAILGLNQSLTVRASNDGSVSSQTLTSGGVKINLHNLLTDHNTTRGVNITDFSNAEASWINIHAAYQKVYNNIKDVSPAPTQAQQELAKRIYGTLSIELPSCYTIKQK